MYYARGRDQFTNTMRAVSLLLFQSDNVFSSVFRQDIHKCSEAANIDN